MRFINLILFFFTFIKGFDAQEKEIDIRIGNELRMNFPGVYFKHNSTEYAPMPYTADSCFKYIVMRVKDIKSYVLWRDSSETEQLTQKRIKKLKEGLKAYPEARGIIIRSMGEKQKVSQYTIKKSQSYEQTQYLLSLNSVFDISTAASITKRAYKICWHCLLRVKRCQVNTFLFSQLF